MEKINTENCRFKFKSRAYHVRASVEWRLFLARYCVKLRHLRGETETIRKTINLAGVPIVRVGPIEQTFLFSGVLSENSQYRDWKLAYISFFLLLLCQVDFDWLKYDNQCSTALLFQVRRA